MKRFLFYALLAAACAAGGYWVGHHSAGQPEAAKPESGGEASSPVATVATVPLEKTTIAESTAAYGSVVAQPGESQSVSVEYESRVVRLLIAPGEQVEKGQALIEIEPSPDAKLQLSEAKAASKGAEQELEQVQQRFSLKLAVNQELQTAKLAALNAEAKLQSFESRGLAGRKQLKAEVAGVAGKINVQGGQIVAAGSPLLEIVPANKIEVRLGLESEEVDRLQAGEAVKLSAVLQPHEAKVEGKIRLITRQVNPATRLIDVFVSIPPESGLLLDSYVRGDIIISAKEALVVPLAAVLPAESKHILFTIKGGRAVKHQVQLGIENATHVEVIGADLQAGDPVVTTGNYVLEDGMAVQTSPTPR